MGKFKDWIRQLTASLGLAGWSETARKIEWGRVEIQECHSYSFPKLLTAPDAVPEVLMSDGMASVMHAIKQRDKCPIAVVLPGNETLLFRDFMLPAVETKKLPVIVKYEASQQIPFDLREVTWQSLYAGPLEIEGDFTLSGNILLAAVKNECVARSLSQFGDLQSRLDLLTIEQLIIAELGRALLQGDETVVLLDMHAGRTQLCLVNRGSVRCRDLPIGGDNFTRKLMTVSKMPFSTAEHLKKALVDSRDHKYILQEMHPEFKELVGQIERSLKIWRVDDKSLTFSKLYITGGPTKLPGLGPYLKESLGLKVESLATVKPSDNDLGEAMSSECAAATVVALQRLGYGHFRTNFLPNAFGFGLKEKSAAWGIKLGNAGISAVKVSLRDSKA